jgi:hypothetical protein
VTGRIGDSPRGGLAQGFYLPCGTARRPAIAGAARVDELADRLQAAPGVLEAELGRRGALG